MKTKSCLILLMALFAVLSAKAQNIRVVDFHEAKNDLTAKSYGTELKDMNGERCALIKVETTEKGFEFNTGSLKVMKVDENHTAEIWVYVIAGAKKITIKHEEFGSLDDYNFNTGGLEKGTTYIMKLDTEGNVSPTPKKEEDLGAFLTMKVYPPTAKVTIDGVQYEPNDSEVTQWLTSGDHYYSVEALNYKTESGSIQIAGTAMDVSITLKSAYASLFVQCNDSEAEIYVNNKKWGVGKCEVALRGGEHRVEARKEGHQSDSRIIEMGDYDTDTVYLNSPTPMYGKLRLKTNPNQCEVFIDGKHIGRSPNVFDGILVGHHKLEVKANGYESIEEQVTITEGETTKKEIELKKGSNTVPVQQSQQAYDGSIRTFDVNGVKFTMILIEGGMFSMGASEEHGKGAKDEYPVHPVILSDFFLGETEVNQNLWEAVMANNPSYFKEDGNLPVEQVSWNDCQEFIRKLNEKCKDQLDGKHFALPTEAQWEYAARGGRKNQGSKYGNGSNNVNDMWYDGNSDNKTHEVGSLYTNSCGLRNMSGNISEWCQDWYEVYDSGEQDNPTGPSEVAKPRRVVRGGSWRSQPRYCEVSSRSKYPPNRRDYVIGLRLSLQ